MMKFIVLSMLTVAGCTKVPENGAMLSASVTIGIQRMAGQTEAMISALAAVERAILDEGWEHIYRKAEAGYRKKHALDAQVQLNKEQRIAIATIAAASRDEILTQIAGKEAELKAQSQSSAQHVIEANRAVQEYLVSLQGLDASRAKAEKTISSVTGIDVDKLVNAGKKALAKLP